MPYGKKSGADGVETDFDDVYDTMIRPALVGAGLHAKRCDEIESAGSIHEDMFTLLATADVAVVDITHLNSNVFYELGARHALKPCVTVLIRARGSATPFNIQDLRIIEYPHESGRSADTSAQIQRFIENGLASGAVDSPIVPVLERVRQAHDDTRRLDTLQRFAYALPSRPGVTVEIRTGDMRMWRGVDVWVNSENTNMQMARFYDRNLSASIRYLGARKTEDGEISEDTVAIELSSKMKGRESVAPGTVFDTTSGALFETHDVKRIFHAALVQGVPGEGYRTSAEMVDVCVERCLRRLDSEAGRSAGWKSIVFPMMGSGAGGGDVQTVARSLVDAIVRYLTSCRDSHVETVVLMAWNARDLAACQRALSHVT